MHKVIRHFSNHQIDSVVSRCNELKSVVLNGVVLKAMVLNAVGVVAGGVVAVGVVTDDVGESDGTLIMKFVSPRGAIFGGTMRPRIAFSIFRDTIFLNFLSQRLQHFS